MSITTIQQKDRLVVGRVLLLSNHNTQCIACVLNVNWW